MRPCKAAYKIVRENDNEIYKGFGFKHLSDATAYYVHRNNESYSGTTTLCQSIGEAVICLAEYLTDVLKNRKLHGEILSDVSGKSVWLDISMPEDWLNNGVTDVHRYKAVIDTTSMIKVCCIDAGGKTIKCAPGDTESHYKLLPVLMLLIVRMMNEDDEYSSRFLDFASSPEAVSFVLLHEDMYQHFKNNEFIVSSRELADPPPACTVSLSEKFANIIENMKNAEKKEEPAESLRFAPEHFREEYRGLVPQLSEEFVLPEKLVSLCSAVTSGDVCSLLFHGPAGTGKTMSCKLICREIGLPLMETVNCTENLDEFILGKYLPENDSIVFHESFVTKAIRFGGAVVFEEINFARPQYLAFLNSLLDDNGFVRLDSGEIVRRHPDFRFFATMNIGYYGTKELNQALYNRFNAIAEIEELSDEAIERMLAARIPQCEEHITDMLAVYRRIKQKIQSEELDMVISPRNLENWARMAKYEGYIAAAEKTIVPIARSERSFEEMIRKTIASYSWKKEKSL